MNAISILAFVEKKTKTTYCQSENKLRQVTSEKRKKVVPFGLFVSFFFFLVVFKLCCNNNNNNNNNNKTRSLAAKKYTQEKKVKLIKL
jgi:hypothetical protein